MPGAGELKMAARVRRNHSNGAGVNLPLRRADRYQVEFCPNCGTPLKAFRRGFVRLCRALKMRPKLPPEHMCMRCGLDIRRVRIAG
jgi:rRNA maturation endonuclease Nob1